MCTATRRGNYGAGRDRGLGDPRDRRSTRSPAAVFSPCSPDTRRPDRVRSSSASEPCAHCGFAAASACRSRSAAGHGRMRIVGVSRVPAVQSGNVCGDRSWHRRRGCRLRALASQILRICTGGLTCYNFVLDPLQAWRQHGRSAMAGLAAAVARAGCPRGLCLITADQRPGDIRNCRWRAMPTARPRARPGIPGDRVAEPRPRQQAPADDAATSRSSRRSASAVRQVIATVLWQSAAITVGRSRHRYRPRRARHVGGRPTEVC